MADLVTKIGSHSPSLRRKQCLNLVGATRPRPDSAATNIMRAWIDSGLVTTRLQQPSSSRFWTIDNLPRRIIRSSLSLLVLRWRSQEQLGRVPIRTNIAEPLAHHRFPVDTVSADRLATGPHSSPLPRRGIATPQFLDRDGRPRGLDVFRVRSPGTLRIPRRSLRPTRRDARPEMARPRIVARADRPGDSREARLAPVCGEREGLVVRRTDGQGQRIPRGAKRASSSDRCSFASSSQSVRVPLSVRSLALLASECL